MAAWTSLLFTLLLCACVHAVVECDSSCSNMQECTMYTIQEVGRKVDNMQSNMAAIVNQLTQVQVQGKLIAEHTMSIAKQGERISNKELENQRQQSSYVSFTASSSETRTYNHGDHVLFDSVLINVGHSYNGENSTFICSHDAYYLFSISVRKSGDTQMHAQTQLDNTPLLTVATYDWQTGSKLVVTYCGEGQRVWVMCHYRTGQVMIGGSGRNSVFLGTLLRLA